MSKKETATPNVRISASRPKKLIHYPGRIEQFVRDGKEVVVGLPLCGKMDASPIAAEADEPISCKECHSIAVTLRGRKGNSLKLPGNP